MNRYKCEKCGEEGLEETDDYFICERCGSAYVAELEYEGWFEEGGDEVKYTDNPFFKKSEQNT